MSENIRNLGDKLGLAIAYSALLVLALVGNSTIIVIYFKWKATFKIYKVTYIFLLSLTLANLAVAVGVMPLSIASLLAGQWVFGTTMCTINGFIFTWMATASILTILLISFHRATVVLSPLRRIIKTGPARIMALFVWIFSLVVPIPPLVGVSTYEYNPTRAFCRVRFVSYDADRAANIYSMLTVSLFVILPLVIVCILNIALYRVSVRLLQNDGMMQKRGMKRTNSSRRISRTIRGELKVNTPQALCIFLNSALNPYIYIYANKETR
ncbi:neuropeptide Y receptor type 1-like [Bolinopsis microptera]|uniref:neuropeptide Y receptor type 1-like n=1 Tax=Bolinopsis microptera TaxID=2820187 RepID=UPI003079B1A4